MYSQYDSQNTVKRLVTSIISTSIVLLIAMVGITYLLGGNLAISSSNLINSLGNIDVAQNNLTNDSIEFENSPSKPEISPNKFIISQRKFETKNNSYSPNAYVRDQARALYTDSAYVVNRKSDGHFHIKTKLSHIEINMLVDTGATYMTLKYEDAAKVGLVGNARFNRKVLTANGSAQFSFTKLKEVEIGGFRLKNLKTLIAPPGALDVSLIGISAITQIPRVTIQNNKLILSK